MTPDLSRVLDGKRVLITGGTGSLGKVLLRRLLSGAHGQPGKIVVLSRDEAKQHQVRVEYQSKIAPTDEVIYRNFSERLEFRIGDVRDFHSVASALRDIDVVFNAAALKQVPTCEYFPYEAIMTNVGGPENIVRAIRELGLPVEVVMGVSTDKAVKPVNVMGMTKSLQERVFARANLDTQKTRFTLARYGNVLASRGSVIPLFHEQIKAGGPVTITDESMTRFLLSLDEAVDVIMTAVAFGRRGETYIPRVPAAKVTDIAKALIGDRKIETRVTGVRPGEKVHESLVSEEECRRTTLRDGYYVIGPILPELQDGSPPTNVLTKEYSSGDDVLTYDGVVKLLRDKKLMIDQGGALEGEFLR